MVTLGSGLITLAQEADLEALVGEDGISAARRRRAADAAIERVIAAMHRSRATELSGHKI